MGGQIDAKEVGKILEQWDDYPRKINVVPMQVQQEPTCEAKDRNPEEDTKPTFEQALKSLINKYSMEGGSATPDFILAVYMNAALTAFDDAVRAREHWYGRRVF